jgi:hypothetical protein
LTEPDEQSHGVEVESGSNQLTIQNNTILVTHLGTVQRIPVQVQRGGDAVIISGNVLVNDDASPRRSSR